MNSIHLINTLALGAPHRFPLPQSHSSPLSPAVSKRQRFSPSARFRLVSAQTVNSVPVSLVFTGSSLFITLHVFAFSYIGFVFHFSARMEVIEFPISWLRSRNYMLLKPPHPLMKVIFVIASMLLCDPMLILYGSIQCYSSGGSRQEQNQWSSCSRWRLESGTCLIYFYPDLWNTYTWNTTLTLIRRHW